VIDNATGFRTGLICALACGLIDRLKHVFARRGVIEILPLRAKRNQLRMFVIKLDGSHAILATERRDTTGFPKARPGGGAKCTARVHAADRVIR
jgi:hypothetical protein